MNGKEKKNNYSSLLIIGGGILVFVLIVFALFSSLSSTSQSQKSGLSVKYNGNTTLKSNTYLNLNFTISNIYDFPLENVRIWVEAGALFTTASKLLSNATTLKTYSSVLPNTSISYFFGNIKIEKVETEMKKVPIMLRILYEPKISKNFTINAVNNNSLQLYGGIENIGIKEIETKKTIKSPLSISFSSNPKDFIFKEGGEIFASFKIIIENSGGGKCTNEIKLKIQPEEINNPITCYYNKMSVTTPFTVFIKPSNKTEIPCNFTLSYLKEKDFFSLKINTQLSCDYLEEKRFYFNIYP